MATRVVAKDVNFLPQAVLLERDKKRRLTQRLKTAVVAGLLAGIAFSLPLYVEARERYQLELLTARYRELEKGRPYREELVAKEKQYFREKAVVEKLKKENISVVAIIDAIYDALPPGLWVTDIEVEAGRAVRLKCEATSTLAAARFMAGLDSLGLFDRIETNEVPLGSGVAQVEFYLSLKAGGGSSPRN
ncbi:PilN domain-containing protein [Syntrophothermus lipocalidus]|uniref:Fimbrial assembly family protein n=1 Tax=Syntrophothermus lipocalidus (strain DSM 12680 / TGB-C1) TaxID=643648 RepID=D7CML6_SYNLT|nr:PilN domain-containing protein [Syntrophothermus lipocalidus]ADI01951.1 Fimbrial assembly family protein [Syntrophothermus lipocalidus DSM 12680]